MSGNSLKFTSIQIMFDKLLRIFQLKKMYFHIVWFVFIVNIPIYNNHQILCTVTGSHTFQAEYLKKVPLNPPGF